jgi:3-methyladenine DNA glycosylase Tag
MLLSYWMNRNKLGAARVEEVDALIDLAKQYEDFRKFIDRYLDHHVGLVQRIFALYESDHVVRTDKIGADMARVFREIGIEFDAAVLRDFPVRNQTEDKPRWPRGLKKRVIEATA